MDGNPNSRNKSCLTQASFERGAEQLVEVFASYRLDTTRTGDHFALSEWEIRRHDRYGLYLVHATPVNRRMASMGPTRNRAFDLTDTAENSCELEDDSILEDATVIVYGERNVEKGVETLWSLSIAYSQTYSVPVIYFTVQYLDGSPCSRDDTVAFLSRAHHQNVVDDPWDFISMDQHPVTGQPSFFLHPCMTSQRMELMIVETTSRKPSFYLLGWMAMVLSSVGLSMPAKLHKYLSERII